MRVFFFKQKTAYEMRISDWSSDVCSSDLLYAQADSLQLLVELRADILRWRNQVAGLTVLERELEGLLSSWFDVGMLELRPITWYSTASLLETHIQYKAVQEIHSWEDLKHHVADQRRSSEFFHPRMNEVRLFFWN